MTGIAVYTRSTSGIDHLLLVQRAPTDSYPNCWEVPGGSVDMTGETILEAAARELKEETGLTVERFVAELRVIRFCTGKDVRVRWWDKPTFVVEVYEAGGVKNGEVEKGSEMERVGRMIKLDEKEHQAWVWASEKDIKDHRCGEVPLVFVSKKQDIMLEGFASRKSISEPPTNLDSLENGSAT
jgi:8-oxo-dGTP pyrophosphatase MutT (NUDIX family)